MSCSSVSYTHLDVYKRQLLFSLTYRSDERTLTDEEVQKAHHRVVDHLGKQFQLQLRQ